jgi:hypothetical protein
VAPVDECGEDLSQAHFELPDAQAVAVAGGTIGRRKRLRKDLQPTIQEGRGNGCGYRNIQSRALKSQCKN